MRESPTTVKWNWGTKSLAVFKMQQIASNMK